MEIYLKENNDDPVFLPQLLEGFDALGDALDDYERDYQAVYVGRVTVLTLQQVQDQLIARCGTFLHLAFKLRLIFTSSEIFIRELDGYTAELMMKDAQGVLSPLPGLLEALVAVDEQWSLFHRASKESTSSLSFFPYLKAIHTLIQVAKTHGFLCTQMAF